MTERTCANCKTQNTPMWRRHPITGDSLCNPCGMYVRKHRKDRPLFQSTVGYYWPNRIGFVSTLQEGPALELTSEYNEYPKEREPEKPESSSPVLFCVICQIEVSDEEEYYQHLVGHAYTPCSVYIERLDPRDINHTMFDQNESGGDDDDADTVVVKNESTRPEKENDNGVSIKKSIESPASSPARSIDSTETIPVASSTPLGIRVKTLKDLMPTAAEPSESSSAVQRLTQQVERLPQAVTISPSVQISKRPALADNRGGPSRKMPRLPESVSLTPAKTSMPPIAPKMSPPVMNRIPPGRGVTVSPMGGGSQAQRGASIAQARQQQSFPTPNSQSVSMLQSRKPGPLQSPQQRGHPELRRSLQSRPATLTCQICDRSFSTPDMLQRHMATSHRGAPSNPQMRSPSAAQNGTFPCNFCRVIYSSEAALNTHKQRIHAAEMNAVQLGGNRGGAFRGGPAPPELALPIVDVSQRLTKQRLSEKGVKYVVRLTNLTNSARTGRFAIPVVPVEQASNTAYSRVASIAAANIIPLGPLTSVKQ